MIIKTQEELDRAIKDFTPYSKVFWVADGELLCEACVRKEKRIIDEAINSEDKYSQWFIVGVDCLEEDNGETCAHCNKQIVSNA